VERQLRWGLGGFGRGSMVGLAHAKCSLGTFIPDMAIKEGRLLRETLPRRYQDYENPATYCIDLLKKCLTESLYGLLDFQLKFSVENMILLRLRIHALKFVQGGNSEIFNILMRKL
jgi:hypothetical protein